MNAEERLVRLCNRVVDVQAEITVMLLNPMECLPPRAALLSASASLGRFLANLRIDLEHVIEARRDRVRKLPEVK